MKLDLEPENTISLVEHLRRAGRAGRGICKRRSAFHYRMAVKVRWDKYRANREREERERAEAVLKNWPELAVVRAVQFPQVKDVRVSIPDHLMR